MRSPNFEKCTALATELLYNQNIKNRILDIQKLDYGERNIIFDTIQNYASIVNLPLSRFLSEKNKILKDGCTIVIDKNTYLVLYNGEINYWEHLNWTLAHEIGHIYLEHREDGEIEEIEAHYFAAQLFMPEYSILMMKKEHGEISESDLIEIFGVSPKAASKRIETMKKRISFRASTIDKDIWKIQKERVDLYFSCGKNRMRYRSTLDIILHLEEEQRFLFSETYKPRAI